MSLFRKLGKKVGRFKHQAESAADDEASYVCSACGTALFADREQCPECGRDGSIERRQSEDASETERTEDASETERSEDASETERSEGGTGNEISEAEKR